GKTVVYTDPITLSPPNDSLADLVQEMSAGQVTTLLILGANPVFTAPVDLDFPRHLLNVKLRIHHGLYEDETAELCHWHIPEAHFLESWGDARAHDGTVGIVQPLIAPLYEGRSAHEVLGTILQDAPVAPHDLVRNYWKTQHASMDEKSYENFWETTL